MEPPSLITYRAKANLHSNTPPVQYSKTLETAAVKANYEPAESSSECRSLIFHIKMLFTSKYTTEFMCMVSEMNACFVSLSIFSPRSGTFEQFLKYDQSILVCCLYSGTWIWATILSVKTILMAWVLVQWPNIVDVSCQLDQLAIVTGNRQRSY